MWNVYLNEELEYISASPFIDLNDQVFRNWNFSHVDPTGAEKGGPDNLYTAGDLAASMSLNPYLKVFLASGYYDAVTPFLQTDLDIESMPLVDPRIRENLVTRYYKSGHMIYLDNESRAEMKKDLANFYQSATQPPSNAFAAGHVATAVVQSQYRRRLGKTPY
jgi:carboxypeptidase C (cathepsin A)